MLQRRQGSPILRYTPQSFVGISAHRGAPQSKVGDDLAARGIRDVGAHELPRRFHQAENLSRCQRCNFTKRIDSARKAHFGFINVADAGDEGLAEQGAADFHLRVCQQSDGSFFRVEIRGQHGRAERGEPRASPQAFLGMKLGDLNIERDCNHLFRGQHDPHSPARQAPLFSRTVDMPASAHEHVRQQSQSAREAHEQPFALRFDSLYGTAANAPVYVDAGKLWQHRFEVSDGLSGERAVYTLQREISCPLRALRPSPRRLPRSYRRRR